MRILFIGDIMGAPGRQIVRDRLADLVETQKIDLVIANCENAASGFGITPRLAQELLDEGIHVLTGGNHIYDRREILDFFPHEPRLLRPANFPAGNPGSGLYIGSVTPRFDSGGLRPALSEANVSAEEATRGSGSSGAGSVAPAGASGRSLAPSPFTLTDAQGTERLPLAPIKFAVLNLQGRVFMAPNDCPFKTADRELARIPPDVKIIVVDFHAEATSEKVAMGWYLDGRVTAVLGTHTHVTSADERILPGGTAVITDVGFTGPHNGVIGMAKEPILQKFLDGLPTRFSVADSDVRMNCVLIDVSPAAFADTSPQSRARASSISRLCLRVD